MRRLRCADCGGSVKVITTPEGHVLGRCENCASEYVLEAKGRQHIILEHRYPDAQRPAVRAGGGVSRRAVLAGSLALGGVVVVLAPMLLPLTQSAPAPAKQVDLLFNVGGEGSSPGQFREQVYELGVDSLGRSILVDNRNRYYLFGPEGQFLANYALEGDLSAKFTAFLPSGELILSDNEQLYRVNAETGRLIAVVRAPKAKLGWGQQFCPTANGGFAVYSGSESIHSHFHGKLEQDELVIFGPTLKEIKRLRGLIGKAVAHDPMVTRAPTVSSVAINAAGSIFLNLHPAEDHDTRGGIYEFNAEGVFQRKIAVEQAWHGQLAVGQDGVLWYADAWQNTLQRIAPEGTVTTISLSGLHDGPQTALGNGAAIATYANGDVALTTMNHRFVRLRDLTGRA